MRRKQPLPDRPAPAPIVLADDMVFTLASAQAYLGLRRTTLKREIRLKRLRRHVAAGKTWISGADLRRWLFGEHAA